MSVFTRPIVGIRKHIVHAPRLFAFVFLTLVACSKTETPVVQVHATIGEAQAAAEKKELAVLKRLVSEKYRDAQGQDKRAIEAVLRYYFLRNESIHVFTRIQSVDVAGSDQAQAVVFVALAGQPLKSAQEFERLRADLYRFDLAFSKEGDRWRVVRADWRSAELGDFL